MSEEEVKGTILKDFGTSHHENEEKANGSVDDAADDYSSGDISRQQNVNEPTEHLDLTQVLALLFIPTLLKAKVKLEESRPNGKNGAMSALDTSHTSIDLALQTSEKSDPHTNTPTIQVQQQPKTAHFSYDTQDPNLDNPHSSKPKRWIINQSEKGGAHHPDSHLIEMVLEMMLYDATGTTTPQPLSRELLRKLLLFYGEADMADDDALIDEMIAVATKGAATDVEGDPVMLDKYTFARALTNDLGLFKIENEDSVTTNYQDVFQTSTGPNKSTTKDESCEGEEVQPVKTVFTYQSVDYTADTFRSKSFVILLWVTWILSYFACTYY